MRRIFTRRMRRRDSRGAAAVEFAIIIPLLCAVLFGIIDYGLWFNDSLSVRQAVRETARQGVVQNFSPTTPAGLASSAVNEMGPIAGAKYARVEVPSTWKRGQPLVVCGMVDARDALVGFVPKPNGGWIESKTRMSIEVDVPTVAAGSADTGTPAGGDWAWCS